MRVGLLKVGFMVDTFGHYNLDLNIVIDNLELYKYIARPSRRERRRRRRTLSVGPVVCSVVVVRPLSDVRPPRCRRRRPLSVRPSRRPSRHRPFSCPSVPFRLVVVACPLPVRPLPVRSVVRLSI